MNYDNNNAVNNNEKFYNGLQSTENIKKKVSIYVMNVELEKGKNVSLKILPDSNPEELAYNFCNTYNLDYNSLNYLRSQIIQLLDNLPNNSNNNLINDNNNNNNIENNNNKNNNIIYNNNNNINNDDMIILNNSNSNNNIKVTDPIEELSEEYLPASNEIPKKMQSGHLNLLTLSNNINNSTPISDIKLNSTSEALETSSDKKTINDFNSLNIIDKKSSNFDIYKKDSNNENNINNNDISDNNNNDNGDNDNNKNNNNKNNNKNENFNGNGILDFLMNNTKNKSKYNKILMIIFK